MALEQLINKRLCLKKKCLWLLWVFASANRLSFPGCLFVLYFLMPLSWVLLCDSLANEMSWSDASLLRRNLKSQARNWALFSCSSLWLQAMGKWNFKTLRHFPLKVAGGSHPQQRWREVVAQSWSKVGLHQSPLQGGHGQICCESWCQMGRPREPKSGAGGKHSTLR